jgi:metallo-beta-lactamase class B
MRGTGLPSSAIAAIGIVLVTAVSAQELPSNAPTLEQLANDNKLFVTVASNALEWEKSAEPTRILGPLYFIGTKGLGAFLFATSEGHILMNTGMPSSGPMMVESIRSLNLRPEDIKIMINGHAHMDHAGAFAYFKELTGAQLAVMKDDVAAMESGGRADFKYADDRRFVAQKKREFEDQLDAELGANAR